jgi:hypothetical protein
MSATKPAEPATKPEATKPEVTAPKKADAKLYVLDTTAVISEDNKTGYRVHLMNVEGAVKPFTFKPGEPLPLPPAVALRFLKSEGFVRTDEKGNVLKFERPPRQPDELQAGETLTLKPNETVARYEELSTPALQHRVLEMEGAEKFATDKPDRKAMIAFIMERKAELARANTSKVRDIGPDEYLPEAEQDGAEDAA